MLDDPRLRGRLGHLHLDEVCEEHVDEHVRLLAVEVLPEHLERPLHNASQPNLKVIPTRKCSVTWNIICVNLITINGTK